MRNMSFMLTTEQVREGKKDVTRRMGWWFLVAGDQLNAVEKCQGLKKGEKVKPIRKIKVVYSFPEPLSALIEDTDYGKVEMEREGFPKMSPADFIKMFCKTHKGCTPDTEVNRIEFEYI